MKHSARKLLAIALCIAMCVSMFPTWAFADDGETAGAGADSGTFEPAYEEAAPEVPAFEEPVQQTAETTPAQEPVILPEMPDQASEPAGAGEGTEGDPDPEEDWGEIAPDDPGSEYGQLKVALYSIDGGQSYGLGDKVYYDIEVSNTGSLPISNIHVQTSPAGEVFQVGSLNPGESNVVSCTYIVTESDLIAGSVSLSATARGSTQSGTEVMASGELALPTSVPDTSLTITVETTSTPADAHGYVLGETIQYKITAVNGSSTAISNITVTDELTGEFWNYASLNPGETVILSTAYVVTAENVQDGYVLHTVSATATDLRGDAATVIPGTVTDYVFAGLQADSDSVSITAISSVGNTSVSVDFVLNITAKTAANWYNYGYEISTDPSFEDQDGHTFCSNSMARDNQEACNQVHTSVPATALVPGVTYYLRGVIRDDNWNRIYADSAVYPVTTLNTTDGITPISMGVTTAIPQNYNSYFLFRAPADGMYTASIAKPNSDWTWTDVYKTGAYRLDSGGSESAYSVVFGAKSGETIYIYCNSNTAGATLTVTDAENSLPALQLGDNVVESDAVVCFAVPEDGFYNIEVSSSHEGTWMDVYNPVTGKFEFVEGNLFYGEYDQGEIFYIRPGFYDPAYTGGAPLTGIITVTKETSPDADSIVSSDPTCVTNSAVTVELTINVTAETAQDGYIYGVELCEEKTFSGRLMRFPYRPLNNICNGKTVSYTIDNLAPGIHRYYRAYLANPNNDQLICAESAVHEFTTTNNLDGYATLTLGAPCSWYGDGSWKGCFEAPADGVYAVEASNLNFLNLTGEDGYGIGGRGGADSYLMGFYLNRGGKVYFNGDGWERQCSVTVKNGLGVLPSAEIGTQNIGNNTPMSFTATEEGNYVFQIDHTDYGFQVLKNGNWQYAQNAKTTMALSAGETVWLRSGYPESEFTMKLSVKKVVPAADYSVETEELTAGAYGATWADFGAIYGAPQPEDGTYYAVQMYYIAAANAPDGFAGEEDWDRDGLPFDLRRTEEFRTPTEAGTVVHGMSIGVGDLVPGTRYYYQAALIVLRDNGNEHIKLRHIFGELREFTTSSDLSGLTALTLGVPAAVPQGAQTAFVFTPGKTAVYAVSSVGAGSITIWNASGGWLANENSLSADEMSTHVYQLGFMARGGESYYIYATCGIPNVTLMVDDAAAIVPTLNIGQDLTVGGRQVVQFTAPATDRYTFRIDSSDFGWLKYADTDRFEWVQNDYNSHDSMILSLEAGQTVFWGSWFDNDRAEVTYHAERYVPATANSISSGEAFDIGNTGANMKVTMSVTDEFAAAGYAWGIQYSRSADFSDWEIWGWSESHEPHNIWTTVHDLQSLIPGTTYYYKACFFRETDGGREIVLAETGSHSFTTTGTLTDLDEIVIGETPVQGSRHLVYRFAPQAGGLYLFRGIGIDYVHIQDTAGNRIPTSQTGNDDNTGYFETWFDARGGETLLISFASFLWGDGNPSVTLLPAADDRVTTALAGTPLTVTAWGQAFRFTALSDGYYEFSVNSAKIFAWIESGWRFLGQSASHYLSRGETVFLRVEYDSGDASLVVNIQAEYLAENLTAMLAMAEQDPANQYSFQITTDTRITGTLTVPMNVTLGVYAGMTVANGATLINKGTVEVYGRLSVESGGTLTQKDSLDQNRAAAVELKQGGRLDVDGTMTCDDNSVIILAGTESISEALATVSGNIPYRSLVVEVWANSPEAFVTQWAEGKRCPAGTLNLVMGDYGISLTEAVQWNFCLVINGGSSVTVPAGAEVDIYGGIAMEGGTFTNDGTTNLYGVINFQRSASSFVNNGTLNLHGRIIAHSRHEGEGTGTVTNNGMLNLCGGSIEDTVTVVGNGNTSEFCGAHIDWELNGNVLTLSGTGYMYDYMDGNVPWRDRRADIEVLVAQEGIEGIGRLAFADLPNLREARLPSTLSYIAYGAFLNDTALTSANLPANLRYVGGCAFQNTGLRAVSVPQSIAAIEYNTFTNCASLSSIELPDQLAAIGWEALKGTALEEIDLPLSLSHIEEYAFDSCGRLRTVNYDGTREDRDRNLTIEETGNDALLNATWKYKFSCGNNAFWTYDEATGELTIYGSGEIWDYRNVDRSTEGAANRTTDAPWWQWQDSMKRLTISEGITGIGASAFYGMRALEELSLPASLNYIGSFAFTGCDSLRTVNYSGTKAKWDALVIGEGNDCLNGVSILYGGENLLAKLTDAENGETVETLPVNGRAQIFVTLGGVALSADQFNFAVDDPSVLSVDANGTVLARQVGSAVITVTLKDNLFGQSIEIPVRVYDNTNDIQLAAPASFLITEDAAAVAAAVKNKAPLTADILLVTPNEKKGVYKYTSSDTGVATVAEKADFSGATVTLKGAGEATITIAPSAKESTIAPVTVTVKVQDFKPRLGAASVTVDPMLSEGVSIPLVESYGTKITEVTLTQSNGAAIPDVRYSYSDGMLTLTTEKSSVTTGTYKNAVLTVKCDGIAEAYSYKLNITVKKSKDPSVTVKQTGKMNIFYSDAAAQLNVTVKNAEITKIECVNHGFYDLTWAYDGFVDVAIRDAYSLGAASQQVTLKITVAGRRDPITKTVKISTVTTAPKLVAAPSSGTLSKGMGAETVTFIVLNQTSGEEVNLTNASLSVPNGYQATVDSSENSVKLKGDKSGTVKIGLSIPGWTSSATVSYKLTVKSITPKLKLGSTTLTLNSAFADAKVSTKMGTDAANVGITGLKEVSFAGKDADKTEADKIGLSFEYGMLVASILNSNVKAGSYKFTVTGVSETGDELSATVTVKVAGTMPKVSVASSKLSLNKKYWGVETVSTAVKLSTKSGYVITGLSGSSGDYGYEFDPQTLMLKVWLLKPSPASSGTLTLTPRVIETASGTANTKDLTPITLTITATDKAATAKLAVSGTLDPIVRGKAVTITPTLQNVSGRITGVTAPAGYIAALSVNAKGAQIIQLFLDRGTAASNGKVSVPITLKINDSDEKIVRATATVTVKQSAVKVTASAAQQVYQGATNPTATFTVKLSSPAGAVIGSVRLADTVTDQVRNCIRNITWTVAGDTATATVSFRNLSTLKAGSSFKIPVVVTPEDCATGVTLKPNADLSFKVSK